MKPVLSEIQWEHLFEEPTWKLAQTFGQTSVQCPAAAVPNSVGEERQEIEAKLTWTMHFTYHWTPKSTIKGHYVLGKINTYKCREQNQGSKFNRVVFPCRQNLSDLVKVKRTKT